jgi:hypothetical protein
MAKLDAVFQRRLVLWLVELDCVQVGALLPSFDEGHPD